MEAFYISIPEKRLRRGRDKVAIIVQKFGGTSVGTVERIQRVAERIIQTRDLGHSVIVVVSAMGKSTDLLVDMAKQISSHPSEREMDMLLSTGEQVSIALLSMALQQKGYPSVSLTGWQAGIYTEDNHSKARIKEIDSSKVTSFLDQGKIVIVAGFQGVTEKGEITTLGRGGSDTTAVALAASVQADECVIFTDVDGVYTADPRIVPQAQKLNQISYEEMLELARLGAGVLHSRAVECAMKHNVRLIVRSSFNAEEGTVIVEAPERVNRILPISGVAHVDSTAKVTLVNLDNEIGTNSSLINALEQANINVDVFIENKNTFSATEVSFSVSEDDLTRTLEILQSNKKNLKFENVVVEDGLTKVSIVGARIASDQGVAERMVNSLAEAKVEVKMFRTSEMKATCLIPARETKTAVKTLHTAFGLDAALLAEVHA
jgi:aspartate kinase